MNTDEKIVGVLTILGIIALGLAYPVYLHREKILNFVDWALALNWKMIGIVSAMIIVTVLVIVFIGKRVYDKIQTKKLEEKRQQRLREYEIERLNQLLNTKLTNLSSDDIEWEIKETNKKIDKTEPEIKEEMQQEIKNFHQKAEEILKQQIQKEELEKQQLQEAEELKRQQEEAKEREFEMLVEELLSFKKEKNNPEALPLNHIYSGHVIHEATWRMRKCLDEKEKDEEKRNEAIEYYKSNDLDSKPQLENGWEEQIYAEIREGIENGKIQLKKKVEIKYQGKKLDKDFYRAMDLDDEAKARARAQGFVQVDGIKLNGKVQGGGYYIRKENSRESAYHFYMKHLFAELHDNMYLEHDIEGRRADVTLLLGDYKLAIEIETGVNKVEQLAAKIPWLNKHFDQWIFVCPRDLQPRYNKYVDNNKSLCRGPKKAKEFVEEVISNC